MKRFDGTIFFGVAVGLAALALGMWLENLSFGFLWHPTAALIVGGGTLGALIVRRGMRGVLDAVRSVWQLRLTQSSDEHRVHIAKLAWLSRTAQKSGFRAFETYADKSDDVLVAQGLVLVAEHSDLEHMKQVLTRRLDWENEAGLQNSITLEAAGGFAPTFGILGAVLGLIGVLRVLDRPDMLGVGIATAFVATIYGIGVANLFFFPLAARLRERHEAHMKQRDEIAVVIMALAAKETPLAIVNQFNLRR